MTPAEKLAAIRQIVNTDDDGPEGSLGLVWVLGQVRQILDEGKDEERAARRGLAPAATAEQQPIISAEKLPPIRGPWSADPWPSEEEERLGRTWRGDESGSTGAFTRLIGD